MAHCEPVTMVTPPGVGQPRIHDLSSELEDIVTAARPHVTNGEIQGLEELLTEYENIIAEDDEDYGSTNKVYHRIYTGALDQFTSPRGE
jgi:hypothetical protein